MRHPRLLGRFAAVVGTVALLGGGAFLGTAYGAWTDELVTAVTALSDTTGETTTATNATTEPESPPATTEEAAPLPPPPPADVTTSPVEVTDPAPPPPTPSPDPVPAPSPGSSGHSGPAHATPVLTSEHKNRPPERSEGGYATIWLHRALPDPTPPAKRVSPRFARELRRVSAAAGVRWCDVLAVARARGAVGRVPLGHGPLVRLASRLALHPGKPLMALADGNEQFLEQLRALSRYNRAVGLRALVTGLEAAKGALGRWILRDGRIAVYAGGRSDIAASRVDVRVLVLIRYLVVSFHQTTVSSLVTGHPLFARPGVVSAHLYGLAVDISALANTPVTGNQAPGGVTDRAIEAILLLPAEMQPQQVISLLGLGGPSFALSDHYDHIHVGF